MKWSTLNIITWALANWRTRAVPTFFFFSLTCLRLLTTFQLFHKHKLGLICCGVRWWSVIVSWCRVCLMAACRAIQMELETRGLIRREPARSPSPFGDTTLERLLLEEEGSFQGPVPGAQRGQRGFIIMDFHGNRLGGAAKVKKEAEEQKMPGRGSRRSWLKLSEGLVQGLGGAHGLGLLTWHPTRGTQKAGRGALVVLRGGRMAGGPRGYAELQKDWHDSASGWNLRSLPCPRPEAVMPRFLPEAVSGVWSLLRGCSGGKFQFSSGEEKCPLAQNLNVKRKSTPCISGS